MRYPNFVNAYKPLIVSLGYLGLVEEARSYLRRLLQLEPGFSLHAFRETYPFRKVSDREHYIEGLRKVGVPEVASPALHKVIALHQR